MLKLTLTGGTDSVVFHSISYDVAGGTALAPTQMDVVENGVFTVAPYSGIKNGYTFGGWSDGNTIYSAGSTYTVGSSNVSLTAVWNQSAYNFEIIGTSDCPNVHIPAAVIPKSGYYSSVSVKYTNDAIDPLSEIISSQVLVDGNPNYSYMNRLSATHPSGSNYVELSLQGAAQFTAPSLLELRVSLSSDNGLETFSVFMPTNGYWLGSLDSESSETQTVYCVKEEDTQGAFQVGINGITAVDSIDCVIPGVSLSVVSDEYASNAGFLILAGTVDWTSVVNGCYTVIISSGSKNIPFDLTMSKATRIDSTEYDYEFVGVTQYDIGNVEWDLGSKQTLLIKVQLPGMISDVYLNGYCVGTDDDFSSVVGAEIKVNSITDRYVIIELTNSNLAPSTSLVVNLACTGAGAIGKLSILVTGTAPLPQNDGKYNLECTATQVDANVHLDVSITKTDAAPSLQNAKLLVIAKYQGGIVVNVYTTPVLTDGNGVDEIEVSSQNLREVIIEIVDGFQHSTPVFYGYCVYKNEGGN